MEDGAILYRVSELQGVVPSRRDAYPDGEGGIEVVHRSSSSRPLDGHGSPMAAT